MRTAQGRLAALSGFIMALIISLYLAAPSSADSPHRVALVVQSGDATITRCISFDEDEISGYEVLNRSGLAITASYNALGAAICAIEGTGCPAESCLICHAPEYWSYWHYGNGEWRYSQKGASSYKVSDGDLEGWVWGQGDPPPVMAYESICEPLPPTATPEPPTATAEPPTATPESPTATSAPATATPTPSPTGAAAPEGWLRLDAGSVKAGECTTMHWGSSNAYSAYLNGNRVVLSGSRRVCPEGDLDLGLRVVGDGGEEVYTVTLDVVPVTVSPTSASSPTPDSGVQQPSATPTGRMTALPSATPRRSATAGRAAATPVSPAETPTPAPVALALATATPSWTPATTATATAAAVAAAAASGEATQKGVPTGYIVFGVLAGCLLLKFIQTKRGR